MDQNGRTLEPGDIVQLDPAADKVFAGCLFVVTEPKAWGMQGYTVIAKSETEGGAAPAYYRAKAEQIIYVGRAEWLME